MLQMVTYMTGSRTGNFLHAGKAQDVVAAHAKVFEAFGAPEVLVYNAGPGITWPPPAALDIDPEVFSRSFDAGVTCALVWSQQVTFQAPCGITPTAE
jgi:NAD(P)-dependent dehydrogenase (short-subunit alcohol dehydrogenase family)